jgi:hypothetical protein
LARSEAGKAVNGGQWAGMARRGNNANGCTFINNIGGDHRQVITRAKLKTAGQICG